MKRTWWTLLRSENAVFNVTYDREGERIPSSGVRRRTDEFVNNNNNNNGTVRNPCPRIDDGKGPAFAKCIVHSRFSG